MSFHLNPFIRQVYIKTVIIAVGMLAMHIVNAQCNAPISLTQLTPSGTVCSPQNVTLRAHYTWSGENYVSGEFRWYTSATDPNPVQVNYLEGSDYMDADYTFYATAGSAVWVSWFDYDSWCESPRLQYTANVINLANFNVQYARECGDGIGRVQVTADASSGIIYDLYWYNPNTANYENIGENSTGYFEIGSFDPSNQYYINISQSGGCSSGYYRLSFDVAAPWAPTVSGSTTVCEGLSTVLTANGSSYSYQWYDGYGNLLYQGQQYTTPTNLSAGTYSYEVRGLSAGGCLTNPAYVSTTVNPKPVNGTISASATTIHPGETVTITSQGGVGEAHFWCSSNGGASWNVLQDYYTGFDYITQQPSAVGTYRYLLRNKTACGFCSDAPGGCIDPYVDVNVIPWPPVQIASVTPAYQIIPYNGTAGVLTVNGVSGGNGTTYTYQWQSSSTSDFASYVNIDGAASPTFTPSGITSKTFFRVVVTSTDAPTYSPVVQVDVYPKLDGGTIIPGSYTIPAGVKPGKLSAGPATGGTCNSYTYQWQVSTDGINFSDITGGQDLTYEPAELSVTTWYRRRTTTICDNSQAYTNVCQINIGTMDVENLNYIRARNFRHAGITDEQTAAAIAPVAEVNQTTEYFDGLGRTMQTVSKQASNDGKDMVTPVFYDQFGRQSLSYLPYVSAAGDGNYKQNPLTELNEFHKVQNAGESFFYGQTVFESSPLNRVLKTMSPGDSWTGSGRGIENKYETNTDIDNVRIWNVTNHAGDWGTYTMDGVYATGTLYKNITVDERGNQTIAFKDRDGKVILKKVQLTATPDNGSGSGHANWLCTYYIYDDFGLLRAVIQPRGVELLIDNNWDITALNGDILNEQCFRYEYDELKRMNMKKVPGSEPVYMVYDTRDRLVFAQDANLRAQNQWLTTLYDDLNRPVITGLTTYTASLSNMQLQASTLTTAPSTPPSGLQAELDLPQAGHTGAYSGDFEALNSVVMNDGFETDASAGFSATIVNSLGEPAVVVDGQNINKSPLPAGASFTVLTTTYYDNYDNLPSGFYTTTLNPSGYTAYLDAAASEYPDALTPLATATGMVTGTKVKVLGEDRYITSSHIYDEKGRVIQVQTMNYTGAMDIITNQYSFIGQLLRSHIKHQKGGTNPQSYDLATKNTYDDLGRLTSVEKNLNGSGWKQISSMAYDALGQLKTKTLSPTGGAGGGPLETLTYDYNIRGWMLGANRDYAKNTSSTDHYFGFDLGYDKQSIASLGNYSTPQFGGNIAGTVWRSKGDGEIRKYDFSYDAVNRLTGADFKQYSSAGFDRSAGVDFSVSNLTYDANGNIKSMDQMGLKVNGSSFVDQLPYTYQNDNSNKLLNVMDISNDPQTKLGDFRYSDLHPQKATKDAYAQNPASVDPATVTDYGYDANGNMNADNNKDITSITYNHLNLPQTITIANKGSIDYTYDAAGIKLKKTVHETGKPDKTTLYLFGTYEDDVLQFLPQEEGRIRPIRDGNGAITSFTYDYFLKDHLGNVRIVLTEEQKTDIYQAGMEDADQDAEIQLFGNKITSTLSPKPGGFDSDTLNHKVSVVNGTTAEGRVGPGVILKVMAGDKINARAFAWYQHIDMDNTTDPGLTGIITNLLGQLVPGVSGIAHGAMAEQVTNGILQPGMESFLGTQNDPPDGAPKAYLNWVLLDEEQFKLVEGNYGAVPIQPITGTQEKQLLQANNGNPIEMTKNGYLYAYVSNESKGNVYFDDIRVEHIRGPLTEETHYYPFGLTMAGISSKALGRLENRFKFNDGTELENKEFSDESGLEWYATDFRSFDPQIGRFHQQDPLGELSDDFTPYAFANNNPILLNDPYGLTGDTVPQLPPVVVTPPKTPPIQPSIPSGIQPSQSPTHSPAGALPLPTYPVLTPVPPSNPPGKVIPLEPVEPYIEPLPLPGILGRTLGVIGGVLWTNPVGNGSSRVPSYLHPFAPDPFSGHGNDRNNSNAHIVYQFTFTPADNKTPVIKYGISDAYRNGLDRPEGQLAMFKAMYGPTVKYLILTRTVNRAHALFLEQYLVTKHVNIWGEMPRAQTRPGPFNF